MDDAWDEHDVYRVVSNRVELARNSPPPVLFGDYYILATLAPPANRFQSAHHCPRSFGATNLACEHQMLPLYQIVEVSLC